MSIFKNYRKGLLFGRNNFMVLAAGMALVVVGFLLMSGGQQPDPDTWKPEEIYGSTRITLAPLVVLLGLGVIVVSIFLGQNQQEAPAEEE